jgi:hypothetical protein
MRLCPAAAFLPEITGISMQSADLAGTHFFVNAL